MRVRSPGLVIVATVLFTWLVTWADTGTARAYPQFQFSTSNSTCTLCHFSPVGGGLINDYGRDEASQTISQFGGNGGLLHGLWKPPEWLALGIDARGVLGAKDTKAADHETLLFPMQLDLYTRVGYKGFSAYFATGACCGAREESDDKGPRYYARDFYAMYMPETGQYYVRAGRFFTPFGLRQFDHTMYVRRDHGMYLGEETFTLAGGYFGSTWDLHVGLFIPDTVQIPTRQRSAGGSVLFEKRLASDNGSWGGHAKVDIDDGHNLYTAGALGKYWLASPGILLLAEADAIVESFPGGLDARTQVLGHLQATYFVMRGLMLGAAFEHYDEDVKISATERDSVSLTVQYFPYAHFEVMGIGRNEFISGGQRATLGMLMLHYYL